MKKQIDLVVISYQTSKAITMIACDNWSLSEDATAPAYSTFTFDKSRINQENFNLIQNDDLIFIKESELEGTPFSATEIQGVVINGGFCQKVETITENEKQFVIKTKSMTYIFDTNILNTYEFLERGYSGREIYQQITESSPIAFDTKYGNKSFIQLPTYTYGSANPPEIAYVDIPFTQENMTTIRDVFSLALSKPQSSFVLLPHYWFDSNDLFNCRFEFFENTTSALPPETLNLDEEYISGQEIAFASSSRPNKVILYPSEENYEYTDIFTLDQSDGDPINLVEDFYTDSYIDELDVDFETAMTKRANELMNRDAEENEISVEMQVGVYDFSQLQLLRSFNLRTFGKEIETQLTHFEIKSNAINKISLSFGYKRLSLMSEIRKIGKRSSDKTTKIEIQSSGIQDVTITDDSAGNKVIEFID